MRDGIFVSYSHADRAWLGEMQHVLDGLPDAVRIEHWDDRRIAPGARWHGEIKEALDTAAAAVLLLSPSFFQSEFINTWELPEIMQAAGRGELVILPLVVSACDYKPVTDTWQSVHDPRTPLDALDEAARAAVWQRLAVRANDIAATITDEVRIGAEMVRLANDVAASIDVAHVLDKMAHASVDPAFEGNDAMRENTLVFLEGERCQATATRLLEEMKRTDLTPARSKAVVRMLQQISTDEERALQRAKELTQGFADQTLAMLTAARDGRQAP